MRGGGAVLAGAFPFTAVFTGGGLFDEVFFFEAGTAKATPATATQVIKSRIRCLRITQELGTLIKPDVSRPGQSFGLNSHCAGGDAAKSSWPHNFYRLSAGPAEAGHTRQAGIGSSLSFGGRALSRQDVGLIRQLSQEFSQLSLTELAATVCELLDWRRPNGGLKTRECFLFLQELRRRGWLAGRPELQQTKPRGPQPVRLDPRSDPAPPLDARHAGRLS